MRKIILHFLLTSVLFVMCSCNNSSSVIPTVTNDYYSFHVDSNSDTSGAIIIEYGFNTEQENNITINLNVFHYCDFELDYNDIYIYRVLYRVDSESQYNFERIGEYLAFHVEEFKNEKFDYEITNNYLFGDEFSFDESLETGTYYITYEAYILNEPKKENVPICGIDTGGFYVIQNDLNFILSPNLYL